MNISDLSSKILELFFNNVSDILTTFFIGLFLIASIFIKKWLKYFLVEIRDGDYKGANDRDFSVYTILGGLMEHYGASRVWLARLHNGVAFANGESFKKYSLTHMVVQDGISWPKYYPKDFQNIPLSYAYEVLNSLFENKSIYKKTKDFIDNGYFRNTLSSNSVTDLHASLIEYNGQPIGFIGITWTKHNKPKSEFDDKKIQESVKNLSILLNQKKKKFLFFQYN